MSNIVNKAEEILDGWLGYAHLINQDQVNKDIAKQRAEECAKCDFIEKSTMLSIMLPDKELKEVQGYKCGKCGCPLSSKVRSAVSQCPEKKWRQ